GTSAATRMFSRTLSRLNSSSRWNVRPSPRRARRVGDRRVTSLPPRRIRPWFGGSRPVITLNNVVLPAPFGPMSPVTTPGSAARLTASSATLPPNRTVAPSTSSSGTGLPFALARPEVPVECGHVVVGPRAVDADPFPRCVRRFVGEAAAGALPGPGRGGPDDRRRVGDHHEARHARTVVARDGGVSSGG